MRKRGLKFLSTVLCSVLILAILPVTSVSAAQGLKYSITQVSLNTQVSNSIANGNTSRNIAVAMDGTIYVVYHCTDGIFISHSSDGGQTMSTPVQVHDDQNEAEVAVSSNGTVYVAWNSGAGPMVARSIDGGNSFFAPVNTGIYGSLSVHMATDGTHVYLIDQRGQYLYSSADSGQTFSLYDFNEGYVFSDIHVNRTTHEVVVQKDDPEVVYYVSSDYGETFTPKATTGQDVFVSVGAVGTDSTGSYLYVVGSGAPLVKTNLVTGATTTTAIPEAKTLSVDDYGNVLVGYTDSIGTVSFVKSNDSGATFDTAVSVDTGNIPNAAINHTNGDILLAYQKNDQIYLAVYEGYLVGYGLSVSSAALSFAGQLVGTSSGYKTVTLTNNGDTAMTIDSITVSGDFSALGTEVTSLAVGESCDLRVRFDPATEGNHTGKVEIDVAGAATARVINLSGVGVDTVPLEISAVGDIVVDAAQGTVTVAFTVTHSTPGFNFDNLILSATSSTGLVSPGSITFSGSNGSYLMTLPIENAAGGVSEITIIANDQVFEDTEGLTLTATAAAEPEDEDEQEVVENPKTGLQQDSIANYWLILISLSIIFVALKKEKILPIK